MRSLLDKDLLPSVYVSVSSHISYRIPRWGYVRCGKSYACEKKFSFLRRCSTWLKGIRHAGWFTSTERFARKSQTYARSPTNRNLCPDSWIACSRTPSLHSLVSFLSPPWRLPSCSCLKWMEQRNLTVRKGINFHSCTSLATSTDNPDVTPIDSLQTYTIINVHFVYRNGHRKHITVS